MATLSTPSLPASPSSTISSTSTGTSTSTSASTSQSSASSSSSSSSSTSSSSLSSSTGVASSTTVIQSPTSITSRTTSRTSTTSGNVVTSTSTLFTTPSKSVASPTTAASGGSTPFIKNKGAVAAVFILVSLVCLGIIVVLARNFQRRRRHEAFDRELQEATRQAAATSSPPFFDDDDDNPYKNHGGTQQPSLYGSAERQFSDASHGTQGTHGTYNQPAMSTDSYGMREIGHPPGPGDTLYTSDPYSAGAAGIGVVRARSMRANDGPYPPFPNAAHMTVNGGDPYASTKPMGVHRYSQHPYAQPPPPPQQFAGAGTYSQGNLDRHRSDANKQANGYVSHPVPNNRYSVVNEETEDAYGGVEDDGRSGGHSDDPQMGAASLPNPFDRDDGQANNGSGPNQVDEPRRVLKVANV